MRLEGTRVGGEAEESSVIEAGQDWRLVDWMCRGARGRGHLWIPGLLFVQLHFLCAAVDAIEGHEDVGVGTTTDHITRPHRHLIEHLPGKRDAGPEPRPASLSPGAPPSSAIWTRPPSSDQRLTPCSSVSLAVSSWVLERGSAPDRERVCVRSVTLSPSTHQRLCQSSPSLSSCN